jgi:hypothetical protein
VAVELTCEYLRFAKDLRAAKGATTSQSLYMTCRIDEKSSRRRKQLSRPL